MEQEKAIFEIVLWTQQWIWNVGQKDGLCFWNRALFECQLFLFLYFVWLTLFHGCMNSNQMCIIYVHIIQDYKLHELEWILNSISFYSAKNQKFTLYWKMIRQINLYLDTVCANESSAKVILKIFRELNSLANTLFWKNWFHRIFGKW